MLWIGVGIGAFYALVFVALAVLGLWAQRRQAQWHPDQPEVNGGISVILPIKGLDPQAAEHYRHWLTQEVATPYEVIFSLQDPEDPVLPLLKQLQAERPNAHTHIIINPVLPGLNGKSSNLVYGVEVARYENLVMADSDIDPPLDLLQRMVPALAGDRVGTVACLPVVRSAANLWGAVTAMVLNMAISFQWAPQCLLGAPRTMSGACFAMRRSVLESIGGFEGVGGYITEDAETARRLLASGLRIVLGPVVTLHQGEGSRAGLASLLTRAAYMSKHELGLVDKVWTFVGIFGPVLLVLGAVVTLNGRLILTECGLFVLMALVMAVFQKACDPKTRVTYTLVYPLLLAGFAAAFLRAVWTDTYQWRGVWYRVERGGRLVLLENQSR